MKYIQYITKSVIQTGKVFKWEYDKECDGYTSRTGAYLNGSGNTLTGNIDEWKDVTHVYNTLVKLAIVAGGIMSGHATLGQPLYDDILVIVRNFEKGVYPSRKDFAWLNASWEEIKKQKICLDLDPIDIESRKYF